jgi:hypothetical protein
MVSYILKAERFILARGRLRGQLLSKIISCLPRFFSYDQVLIDENKATLTIQKNIYESFCRHIPNHSTPRSGQGTT